MKTIDPFSAPHSLCISVALPMTNFKASSLSFALTVLRVPLVGLLLLLNDGRGTGSCGTPQPGDGVVNEAEELEAGVYDNDLPRSTGVIGVLGVVGAANEFEENNGGGAIEAMLEAREDRLERDVEDATLQIELRTELAAEDEGVY